jgi:hypothetical protein
VETVGWEGRGVLCDEPAPPNFYPPPVSVKDTSVYGPSKPSSHHQQILGFAPTASLVGSGEKLGTHP